MPKNSKYSALNRSSIVAAIHQIELQLEHCRPGLDKDRALRKEREQLFEALRAKDDEIFNRWKASNGVSR